MRNMKSGLTSERAHSSSSCLSESRTRYILLLSVWVPHILHHTIVSLYPIHSLSCYCFLVSHTLFILLLSLCIPYNLHFLVVSVISYSFHAAVSLNPTHSPSVPKSDAQDFWPQKSIQFQCFLIDTEYSN
jgi:hypothetical protein